MVVRSHRNPCLDSYTLPCSTAEGFLRDIAGSLVQFCHIFLFDVPKPDFRSSPWQKLVFTKRIWLMNKTTLLWSVGWHKANAVWQLARAGHGAMQVLLGGACVLLSDAFCVMQL